MTPSEDGKPHTPAGQRLALALAVAYARDDPAVELLLADCEPDLALSALRYAAAMCAGAFVENARLRGAGDEHLADVIQKMLLELNGT